MSAHEIMERVRAMTPRIEAHLAAHPAGDTSPGRIAWFPSLPGEGVGVIVMKALTSMSGLRIGWSGRPPSIRDRTRFPDGTPNGLVPVPFHPERIAALAPDLDLLVIDASVEVDPATPHGQAVLAAPCRIIVIGQPPGAGDAIRPARTPGHA